VSKQLSLSRDLARMLDWVVTPRKRIQTFVVCVLIGIIFVLYANSLGNEFVNWDDPGNILKNEQIQSLDWSNIKDIFTIKKRLTYQPIRVLSYAVDYRFWKLNPLGYHITNIAFYIATCIVVFFATLELLWFLRPREEPLSNVRIAFFTALFFATHPVHVEAVTWLSGRKEVLLGFFFFSSFFCYLKAAKTLIETRKAWLYGLAFLSFTLAVLSKPVAVVLPGIILLFEFSRSDRDPLSFLKRGLFWSLPTLLVSFLFVYILIKIMIAAGGIYPYRGGGFFSNFLLSFYFFILNIKLMALTVNYSPVYTVYLPYQVFGIPVLLCVLLNIGLISLAILLFNRNRLIFFSILCFYITMLPFSNIIPISTVLADRYAFISSFAFCLVLGSGFDRLWSVKAKPLSRDFFPLLAAVLLAGLLTGYGYMTIRQNRIWRNSLTLWTDALEKHPDNVIALNILAVIYIENGAHEKAFELLSKAVEIDPSDPLVHNNLGIVYKEFGQYEKSESHYRSALALKPGLYEPRVGLGILFAVKNDFDKAIEIFEDLLVDYPGDSLLHFRLGFIYEKAGKLGDAVQEYKKSIEMTPNVINPYESLGRLYLEKLNDRKKALYFFKKGAEMAPHSKRIEPILAIIKRLSAQ
jgi:Tfp pilus assembly protein PilF